MHHHINHCWCSESEHNGDYYDAPNMVEINKHESDADDWDSLVYIKRIVSKEDLEIQESVAESMKEKYPEMNYSDEMVREMASKDCPFLKEEVQQWLSDNIKQKGGEPGWAIGSEQYRLNQGYQITLWFQRRNDAKKFIKTFSKWKKSTSYFNYLKDPIINKVLDTETGKYHDRHN